MADELKAFTPEEAKAYYATLMAQVINGDADKKTVIDECATRLLTKMHSEFPTLSDKSLGTFASSTAYLFAQTMGVPAGKLSEFLEHTFNDYLAVAAVLAGGYDPESTEVPAVPEVKMPEEPVAEAETYTGGNYL